ncbi:hypothetical protein F8388_026505 [Cannabis sativa]|uniref:Zinc finger PHD-type domain-containing protein n=1 Tax=Cannabis sativa TaxID=3483 RepID=A0A7J6DXA9_CANSA|nr:hypothetical protein F8388_026505 [Cannabis sativa]
MDDEHCRWQLGGYGKINNTKCRTCNGDISGSFYVCYHCDSYAHADCYEKIKNHPFHPSEELIFLANESFICNCCHTQMSNKPCFTCRYRHLFLDVHCARMPPITSDDFDNQDHIQHFSHPHPMPLILATEKGGLSLSECFACRLPCFAGKAYYGCKPCKYFLHESCAKLPLQLEGASFHKHHALSLRIANQEFLVCTLCYKSDLVFAYECGQCEFHYCVNCVTCTSRQTVKYEYHDHPLFFLDKIHTGLVECYDYDSYCKNPILAECEEFKYTNSAVFGCDQECNFKVHLLCGPLPSTLKYEYHIHPLILFDFVLNNDYGDFYCDICEMKRDPRIRVYFCEDCNYVAHVHCLTTEGDLKDVKLKTVGNDLWKFPEEMNGNLRIEDTEQSIPLTLRDLILFKLTESEQSSLGRCFSWDEKDENEVSKRRMTPQLEDKTIDEVLQFSNFTESQFMNFIFREFNINFNKNFDEKKMKIESSDLALKIVDFKGYFIPLNVVSVFKTLLHKYGDIAEGFSKSKAYKSICYFLVCKVMKEMHTTFIIDITKDLLQRWFDYIVFAEFWGYFDVDFLEASLREITRDFFYLKLTQILEVDIPTIIRGRIKEVQKKIAEEQMKISNEQNKMVVYKKFCESTSKKEFMKEGLNKVMKHKWKVASKVGRASLPSCTLAQWGPPCLVHLSPVRASLPRKPWPLIRSALPHLMHCDPAKASSPRTPQLSKGLPCTRGPIMRGPH